jgi:hypothetical protein
MTKHLDERIMHSVLALLIPSTMEHHNNYACDGVTWTETYENLMCWENCEDLTTNYVHDEVSELADADRDTVRTYARQAMRLIHAMGEDRARQISEGGTR